jgi:hypothetical protein
MRRKVKVPKNGFKIHQSAEVFPMMSRQELEGLKASIEVEGLLERIAIVDDQIIDGRNRYKVLQELGRADQPDDYEDFTFRFAAPCEEWHEPIDYVVAKNLHRRHLNVGQRAESAVKIKKRKALEAKERKRAYGEKFGEKHPKEEVQENVPEPLENTGQARDQAGELVGVSGRTVDHAEKVFESENSTEELKDAVRSGEVAVSSAAAIVDLPTDEQREAIAKGKKGVAEAAKRVKGRRETTQPPQPNITRDEGARKRNMSFKHGQDAINCLCKIKLDDERYKDGFLLVQGWMDQFGPASQGPKFTVKWHVRRITSLLRQVPKDNSDRQKIFSQVRKWMDRN